ncbi:cytochrome c [Photobacterium sagamiensis]|uniref:c-type cytochrome n=1 Tax=Photobacterium sagamiensis TaxID=2910241 RepID=UPI003D0DFCAB
MNKILILTLATLSISVSASASEQGPDAKAGKMKAYTCQFCHGINGKALKPDYPNISGQNEMYLNSSMKAYQNGERAGPMGAMMKQQLSSLNDQDIADIAAYYAKMD